MDSKNESSLVRPLTAWSSQTIDLARGLLCFVVAFGHLNSFIPVAPFLNPPSFPYIQSMAVVGFFALSGFILPYSVFRKLHDVRDFHYGRYVIDRFSRIFVPFVPTLGLVMIYDHITRFYSNPGKLEWIDHSFRTFVINILMIQNLPDYHVEHRLQVFGSAGNTWTIPVEWWIYLTFGGILFAVYSRRKRWPEVAFAAITAPVALFVTHHYMFNGHMSSEVGRSLTLWWMLGAVGVYICQRSQLRP